MLLVFAHRELVDSHVEACRRAGLKLDGVDLEAFALLRALAAAARRRRPTRPALSSRSRSDRSGRSSRSRTGASATSPACSSGAEARSTSPSRAPSTSPRRRPSRSSSQLSLDGDASACRASIPSKAERTRQRPHGTSFRCSSRELVASLQFYQARPGSLDIGEILLSGGGAELAGFAAELEQLIGVPVSVGDPFSRVVLGRKVTRPDGVGLARGRNRPRDRRLMRAVNLVPKNEGRGARSLPSPWILVAALAPILAIVIVVLGYSHEQLEGPGEAGRAQRCPEARLDALQASGAEDERREPDS